MSQASGGGPHERTVGRWYSVTRDGLACLCLDEANARAMAAQCDRDYPKHAPHKAMQLVDAAALDGLRAGRDALRTALERCYDAAQDGPGLTVGEQHKIVQMLQPNAEVSGGRSPSA